MHKSCKINSSHMAKKRKLESQTALKIEEEEHIVAGEEEEDPEEIIGDEADEDIYEEVEFEEEEEEYEEEEEEEEYEEEEEEDDPHNDGDVAEEPIPSNNAGGGEAEAPVQSNNDGGGVDEEEEEPIRSVLAAFSKEALVELLSDAAERHADVAARVRAAAVVDPSQRKIFVHGLNWDTTSETLLKEFAKYGEIEDCRVIANKITGRSKGYGFVLFKTCRAARHALKEPQKLIDERMTCSQLASLGPVAAALPQKPQPVPEYSQRKIFVSNVGEELDPEKVKDFFSKFGEIEEGPLGLDRETGRPKGFCLFTYKTMESAKLALVEPHKQFEGATLHCHQAIDGPKFHKKAVAKNQQFVDNVASSGVVDSTMVPVPPYMQAPPMMQQPQPMNMDPAAVGHALTTLLAAQGGGLNLLGALGAMGPATGLLNNSGMVPGFGGPVVQGPGYGMASGMNMGSNGSWNHGGYLPNQMRWRGRGRGHHGPWPGMGQ